MVSRKSKFLPVIDGNSEDSIVHEEVVLFASASSSVSDCPHQFFIH